MADPSDQPLGLLELASLGLLEGRLAHRQLRRSGWLAPLLAKFLGIKKAGQLLYLRPVGTTLTATVNEHDQNSFIRGIAGGSVALTQSYARGEWDTPDLYQLLLVLFRAERVANLVRFGALPVE